ncbi:MAG: hypothetical protein KA450_03935 [Bacteroidia bacterium]|nr:hypothetical protein [Bacteroidia bacterium]
MTLKVSHRQGGRSEFEKTGIYPNYLIFTSEKYGIEWKVRIENESQTGSLSLNGKEVYNYNYGNGCQIQEVFDDGTVSDWMRIRINTIMVD